MSATMQPFIPRLRTTMQVNTGKAQKRVVPQKRSANHAYPQFFLEGPDLAENALRAASETHIASAEHCIGQIMRHGQIEHEDVEEPKAMR